MGKTAKIILGVLGFFVIVCIVAVVAGGTFLKQKVGGLVEETQRAQTEARTWGPGHTQADCIDEGMRRARGCTGFSCQVGVQTFTSTCLSAAAPTPGICDGVPHPQDFRSGALWRSTRCPVTGAQSVPDVATRACQQVMPILQNHCAGRSIPVQADASVAPAPTAEPTPAPTAAPAPTP